VATSFSLDLAGGLTQVLQDGDHTYLYGNERIGQFTSGTVEYFLGDALGSVRQLIDGDGVVAVVNRYEPYGELVSSVGAGSSAFGFTGEWESSYINLINLRSRLYSPYLNQFIQRDTIVPDYRNPQNLNLYSYGLNNPLKYIDPSGHISEEAFDELFGLTFIGNWPSDIKHDYVELIRIAVLRVGDSFYTHLGGPMSEPPITNAAALFTSAYGIHNNAMMNFEWNKKCHGCRPKACIDAHLWVDQDPDKCDCEITGTCYCLPVFGYTMSDHRIMFASMWSDNWPNSKERRINNVIHELGHAFNGRLGGVPATLVQNTSTMIDGERWSFINKPEGFYLAEQNGNMTYMQSKVESESEAFADMFLGWVYDLWAHSDYGKARSDFMDQHMRGWILQAMSEP